MTGSDGQGGVYINGAGSRARDCRSLDLARLAGFVGARGLRLTRACAVRVGACSPLRRHSHRTPKKRSDAAMHITLKALTSWISFHLASNLSFLYWRRHRRWDVSGDTE